MTQMIYAGIGSRKTPGPVQNIMIEGAGTLLKEGWLLRSGHADGADLAFEIGAGPNAEIHLPWRSYNADKFRGHGRYIVPTTYGETEEIAERFHPVWDKLSIVVQKLMCRNVSIILGEHLNAPAEIVICWTPGGQLTGGTAHGIKIATAYNIPVFNLGSIDGLTDLSRYLWGAPK